MKKYLEKTDTKSDEEAVRKWMEQYVANNNAGDFDSFGSFWTEDVIWLPPSAPIVIGKAAILDYARPFFTQYNIDQNITVEEVKVADSFAYIRIAANEKYTPTADDTEPIVIRNKGILLLSKESDGSWAATHCIWNYNSPSSQQTGNNDKFIQALMDIILQVAK